jgi:hypothetical protein
LYRNDVPITSLPAHPPTTATITTTTTTTDHSAAGHAKARAAIVAALAAVGVAAPAGEVGVEIDAERPVGHSTHNLFLKDKKSKKLFMVSHR